MNGLRPGSAGCRVRPVPKAVFLFGSVARGARDFRDVDMLFVISKERDKEHLRDAVAGGFGGVQRRYKVPVSVIVATEAELGSANLASVVEAIRREGILIGGAPSAALRDVRSAAAPRRFEPPTSASPCP